MFVNKKTLALFLFAIGINICGGTRSGDEDSINLSPDKFFYTSQGKGICSGAQLVATRVGNAHLGIVCFDTSVLKNAVDINVVCAEISMGVQFIEGRKDGTGNPVTLGVHRLLKKKGELKLGDAFSPQAGESYEAEPFASQELPAGLKKGDVIKIGLPVEDIKTLLPTLDNGIVLKLTATGGPAIYQVNFFTDKVPNGNNKLKFEIIMQYKSSVTKLSLYPIIRPVSGKYVTRAGADFSYDGKPIRFMGVNCGVDGLKSYKAIDNYITRMRNMNINAIRLWATGYPFYTPESTRQGKMVDAVRGDGSKLDLYDYFVYKCQEAGIFIYNTSLGSHTPPMEYWPDNDIILTRKNEHYDHNFYNVFPIMTYLSEKFAEARIKHIQMYLTRKNLYTGQRYAEMPVFALWELTNENHTVAHILEGKFEKWPPVFKTVLTQRWNEWLKRKYGTNEALLKAWGKLNQDENLENGSVYPAPTYSQHKDYPRMRNMDFVDCVQYLFIKSTKRFEAAARACAPTGIGINTAPIVANTHATLNMHGQYASSVCDFASVGAYQTPYTDDKSKPFYPWRPYFSERPYFYNLNFQTLKNKPFVVYENSFFRPYHYRAEWAPAIALLGAGLGWDGIFFYSFGQQWAISDSECSPLGFLGKSLKIPTNTSHDGYCVGFHHGNDEVMMASMALTSQAFINGISPNRESVVVTYGKNAIHNPAYRNYSQEGATAQTPQRVMAGGENEWYSMPNIYRKFMHSSVRKKLQLDFDERQEAPIRVNGSLSDKIDEMDADKERLSASEDIVWDPAGNRFMLDCKHSKLVVGIMQNVVEFNDNITLSKINRDFAFFGISSRDGKDLAESSEIILAAVSTSSNTGYRFDPSKIKGSTLGHINGVVDCGTAPVQVSRVGFELKLPVHGKTMHCYNFAGYAYRKAKVNGVITISSEEPLFLAIIN